ncbi:hypothetical protein OF83DRAFT_1282253 [Amylostereum chailletii]|nr:hypothetical protein OF83DRAFT_1282253 [Amylostereum chailletii]
MYTPSTASDPCPSTDSACTAASSTSFQSQDTQSSSSHLANRNLIGIVVVAVLVLLAVILWLFFGRWSKPIRHFFRCGPRRPKAILPKIEWENSNMSQVNVGPFDPSSRSPSLSSEKPSIDYLEEAHVRHGMHAQTHAGHFLSEVKTSA